MARQRGASPSRPARDPDSRPVARMASGGSSGWLERVRSARRHGGVAGFPYAEDEHLRLGISAAYRQTAPERFRAEIRLEPEDAGQPRTIHFDVVGPFEVSPPALADAALLIGLFPAMLRGGQVHVEGEVSRRLARNLIDLQAIWLKARPERYRPFRLTATRFVDGPVGGAAGGSGAIMPFSGGVDSMVTLCRQSDPERSLGGAAVDLQAGLFLPGFAPSPAHRDQYQAITARVRRAAASRGLPLIVAETNFTECVPYSMDNHGSLLAGALHLFSERFPVGLIAASYPHQVPVLPYFGSLPHIDPFCSSAAMEIRNDGGDLTRDEKCAALSRDPDVLDHLNVCFEFRPERTNCCRCAKCTRTMLNFLAAGEEIPEKAFPLGLELKRVGRKLTVMRPMEAAQTSLHTAREQGVRHPALRRLARRVRVARLKVALRTALTWLLPRVDLLEEDYAVPRWLVERRARAANHARRAAARARRGG